MKKNKSGEPGTRRLIAPGLYYETAATKERESWGGIHFIQKYQNCNRKWFIAYVLGVEAVDTAYQLIGGAAFHHGKAKFYRTGNKIAAVRDVESYITKRKDEFTDSMTYARAAERYPAMLTVWIDTFGMRDMEEYEMLFIEEEIVVPVPGTAGFYATMRPDTILQDKDRGYQWIMETKTTEFSKVITDKGVFYSDQATMYIWGAKVAKGITVDGVIPDVTYWHKQSNDPGKIECIRGDIATRSEREVESFVKGLGGILNEISQKALAYREGMDPEMLFARNTARCMDFFRPCEFVEICRRNLSRRSRLPEGMRFSKKTPLTIKRRKYGS